MVLVDKPAGPSSHDVVNRLRHLYGTRRVGHAGTLDPPATGVLVVGLGRATRVLQFVQVLPKCYRAEGAFGATTSTQDATGEVLVRRPCTFSAADLAAAAATFVGDLQQVPPMVSAVRIGGERLYEAARRGEEVDRPARPVTVYAFDISSFDASTWRAVVSVRCSSGTYVRTLAADLGEALGCGAHVTALRRTSIGSLRDDEAVTLPALEAMDEAGRAAAVLPMAAVLRDLASVQVAGEDLAAVAHGRPLAHDGAEEGPVAVLDPAGGLLAVYRRDGASLRPVSVLA